jgi:hypothetical protein
MSDTQKQPDQNPIKEDENMIEEEKQSDPAKTVPEDKPLEDILKMNVQNEGAEESEGDGEF